MFALSEPNKLRPYSEFHNQFTSLLSPTVLIQLIDNLPLYFSFLIQKPNNFIINNIIQSAFKNLSNLHCLIKTDYLANQNLCFCCAIFLQPMLVQWKKTTTHLLPKPFCICTVYVIDSKSLWVCFIFMICYNNSKLYFANYFSWSFLYVYTFGRIVWTPPKMKSFIEHLMHR